MRGPRLLHSLMLCALLLLVPLSSTASVNLLWRTPETSLGNWTIMEPAYALVPYVGIAPDATLGIPRDYFMQVGTDSLYLWDAADFSLAAQWSLPWPQGSVERCELRMWDAGDFDLSGARDIILESKCSRSAGTTIIRQVRIIDLARGPQDPIAVWEDPDDTTSFQVSFVSLSPVSPELLVGILRTHYCPPCGGGIGSRLQDLLVYSLGTSPTSVSDDPTAMPARFALTGNRPNPFRSETSLEYVLAQPAAVRLRIYDPAGRSILSTPEHQEKAGAHRYRWDGTSDAGLPVPPGTYFYELQVDGATQSRKAILLR